MRHVDADHGPGLAGDHRFLVLGLRGQEDRRLGELGARPVPRLSRGGQPASQPEGLTPRPVGFVWTLGAIEKYGVPDKGVKDAAQRRRVGEQPVPVPVQDLAQ
ncbi:hypothetical protein Lfu02_41490 [Longispora fulva]|uniref:Uncharacterized protein n=1 Tax=Longispora fulva TaxID=619741 RepID=A0A8J7GA53_9ACTN|nr:hypothetical protein [Longispora fulva]MBG6136608.1 hypothetical protein [Longispora fulva]GIG59777.1 hypothetical protein Lfu02_41490 [Longispora fulva]